MKSPLKEEALQVDPCTKLGVVEPGSFCPGSGDFLLTLVSAGSSGFDLYVPLLLTAAFVTFCT